MVKDKGYPALAAMHCQLISSPADNQIKSSGVFNSIFWNIGLFRSLYAGKWNAKHNINCQGFTRLDNFIKPREEKQFGPHAATNNWTVRGSQQTTCERLVQQLLN